MPALLLLGEADTESPAAGCVEWAKRGQAAGRTVSVTVYPGAHHGFDMAELGGRILVNARGHVMRYDPETTADAEKRIRAFLATHLRRAP
jgi:dienelactone hydrolase